MQHMLFDRMIRCLVAGLAALALACPSLAEADKARVDEATRATVLVEIRNEKGVVNGSAFCIDATGLFITNDHLATAARKGDRIELVLNAGTTTQRAVVAKVVRSDPKSDLAILRVEHPGDLTSIDLASDATLTALVEKAQLTLFGHPLGTSPETQNEARLQASITISRITGLRRDRGELQSIQLDGALNPGNSGGPVLDESGNVIGVATAGIPDARIAFAIPVSRVRQLLGQANIVLVPKVLTEPAIMSGEIYGPRFAVPDEAAQAQAAKTMREVYAKQYADAKPQSQWALASTLLTRGEAMTDDRVGQYVLLREAVDIAVLAGDFDTALRAISLLGRNYEVSTVDLKADAILKLAPRLKKPEEAAQIAAHGLLVARALALRESYANASRLIQVTRAALAGQSPAMVSSVRAQLATLETQCADYENLKPALDKLKAAPADPQANLAAGRFYCFTRGEFERGLPMLARANDTVLAALAAKELAGAHQPEACAALGDEWWALADTNPTTKAAMQTHAAEWYRKALPGLVGLAKDKAAHRLADVPSFAAQTPEEIIKSKALSKVGFVYLLEGDIKLPEDLRAMRLAKRRIEDIAAKRAELDKEIQPANEEIYQAQMDAADLSKQLTKVKKSEVDRYNKIAGEIRIATARQAEAQRYLQGRLKELAKLTDPSTDYITSVQDLSAKVEAMVKEYELLAANPDVKAALAAINGLGGPKMTLGPSEALTQALTEIRQAQVKVSEQVIKFEIAGGVPQVNVTLNGKLNTDMVFDSGAAWVMLTAATANDLGLKPGPNDAVVHSIAADGKATEVKVMTLKSVRLGQFMVENVPCVVNPSSVKGSNLLGGTFLRNFVFRVDLATHQIHMSQMVGKTDPDPIATAPSASTAPTTAPTASFTVPARSDATYPVKTGIHIARGEHLIITPDPEGRWSGGGTKAGKFCDYRGYNSKKNENWMKMFWRVGNQVGPVTAGESVEAQADGEIELFCWDDNSKDNQGEIKAKVERKP